MDTEPIIKRSAEYYRERAKVMLKQAAQAHTAEGRLEFMRLAEHWDRLAQRIELHN